MKRLIKIAYGILFFLSFSSDLVASEPFRISILHTNDLHARFRPDTGPLHLGGFARLKTQIDRLRATLPNVILVDGGDWAEGTFYYTEGVGSESVRMLDFLGYDVAVIGNHDWLNGPDYLLKSVMRSQPRVSFVSANLQTAQYPKEAEFNRWIVPYAIKKVGSVQIAFIGLSTYEWIYDRFFAPVNILDPTPIVKNLAAELKSKNVNFVVAISHNDITKNKEILSKAPDLDLVIGAHDHVQLNHPIEVNRRNRPTGWIVEAGHWGQFLGQVDLSVSGDGHTVSLADYHLMQIDSKIPEDPEVLARIEEIENRIEQKWGPVFHDETGHCEFRVQKEVVASQMGNLVTDALKSAVPDADLAFESIKFVYGELNPGVLRTADLFHSYSAVYNPETNKSYTLKKMSMKGNTIKWILYLLYASKRVSSLGLVSASGLEFVHDPLFASENHTSFPSVSSIDGGLIKYFESLGGFNPLPNWDALSIPIVTQIKIRGEPLDKNKYYTVAISDGVVKSFEFVNNNFFRIIPMKDLSDTGLEQWRVLQSYVKSQSPLTPEKVSMGRIRTLKPDLGVFDKDIQVKNMHFEDGTFKATIEVHMTNYGATPTPTHSTYVNLLQNQNGTHLAMDSKYSVLASAKAVGVLQTDESVVLTWENVPIPVVDGGQFSVTVKIDHEHPETNINNQEHTKWFEIPDQVRGGLRSSRF